MAQRAIVTNPVIAADMWADVRYSSQHADRKQVKIEISKDKLSFAAMLTQEMEQQRQKKK